MAWAGSLGRREVWVEPHLQALEGMATIQSRGQGQGDVGLWADTEPQGT